MYKANLDKKLAVKAVRNLFLSVGMGSVGLNNLLKKFGMNLTPAEFFMLVFKLQHQQGWGVPFKLVGRCQSEVFIDGGFEGVLIAVTGKNWFCSEIKCQANGDDCCEFVADKKRIQLEMEGRGYRQR